MTHMKKCIAGIVATATLALAPAAGAITIGQAGRLANAYQGSVCGDFWHLCVNASSDWPICSYFPDGPYAWWCGGTIEELYWPSYKFVYCGVDSEWRSDGTRFWGRKDPC